MALIDKETIYSEIERIRSEAVMASFGNETYWLRSRVATCVDILAFLDTLPEQPGEGLDKARFLEVLDKWEAHAIRGMRNGATAYHQGKIALITDLRDWINREG